MSYQHNTLHRKSSAPWDRLRPVKQDPLDAVGFVSRGDNRLLNSKAQESYYHKITARYMQFCAHNSKNLNDAFASLSLDGSQSKSGDASQWSQAHVSANEGGRPATPALASKQLGASRWAVSQPTQAVADPADELAIILTALRKLREGMLASSRTAPSPLFSQRVHVFNIRLAILAHHPESYHASLRYLVTQLHSREHPLPTTELREMLTYLILDTALRLGDLNEAYRLRVQAKAIFDYRDRNVDLILKAVVMHDWPLFWLLRGRVDGYVRAIMHWNLEALRSSVLKAVGRSYLKCDVDWILRNAVGGELSWDDLVSKENIGWIRDDNIVIIRKPKLRS